ncbi:MAG: dihydrodipicolinate synthase family protein [SAR202 cluster bacterium]|nr:dihydrodipicolinate synthase family protein [SAR202 cluster bacterium]
MNREENRKLIVGPIGAIPTPFDSNYNLNLGAMHDMVQYMVGNGVSNGNGVIKVASAIGEGPMLRDSEWPALLRTVVRAANGKAPVMFGIHYKDTFRAIEDAKRAQDLGAIGLQIAPPVYNIPTQQDMYDYYSDVGKAIEIGIMIYHTHWIHGGRIETDTFHRMRDLERVIAIKWSPHGDGQTYEDMEQFVDHFNIIDNSANPVRCFKLGGHGWVQTTLDAYPPHELKVLELLRAGQYEKADEAYCRVYRPIEAIYAKLHERTGGQSLIMKGLAEVMGHKVGASRPPSKPLTVEEMTELRTLATSWGWPVPTT